MFDLEGLRIAQNKSIKDFYKFIERDAIRICNRRGIHKQNEQESLINFCIALFIEEIKRDDEDRIENPVGYFMRIVSNQSLYDVKQYQKLDRFADSLDEGSFPEPGEPSDSSRLDYLWVLEQIIPKLPENCQKILRPSIYNHNRSGVIDIIVDKLGFTRGSARVKKSFCEKEALKLSMEFIKRNGLYE